MMADPMVSSSVVQANLFDVGNLGLGSSDASLGLPDISLLSELDSLNDSFDSTGCQSWSDFGVDCNKQKKSPFHESVTSDYSSMYDPNDVSSPESVSNCGDEARMDYTTFSFDDLVNDDDSSESVLNPELLSYVDDLIAVPSVSGNKSEANQVTTVVDDNLPCEVDVETCDVDLEKFIRSESRSSKPHPPVAPTNSKLKSFGSRMKTRSAAKASASEKVELPITQNETATSVVQLVTAPKRVHGASQSKSTPDDPDIAERNRKAAIQARINRQKKKHYIQGLEDQINDLTQENNSLKENNRKLLDSKSSLEEEVEYLKSVLANQSALSGLLKNIGNVQSVSLTSSFMNSRKRSLEGDHEYPAKKRKNTVNASVSGGVCLHVENQNVSLEFCSKCAKMAKGACRDQP